MRDDGARMLAKMFGKAGVLMLWQVRDDEGRQAVDLSLIHI